MMVCSSFDCSPFICILFLGIIEASGASRRDDNASTLLMRMRRLLFLLNIGGGDRNVTARSELLRRELSVGALHDIPRSVAINRRVRSPVAVIIGGRGNVQSIVIKMIKKRRDRFYVYPFILFDFNKNLNGNGCSVKFNKGKAVKSFVV